MTVLHCMAIKGKPNGEKHKPSNIKQEINYYQESKIPYVYIIGTETQKKKFNSIMTAKSINNYKEKEGKER